MVLVPMTIQGEGPFTFVQDTGASASAVDDDVAREPNLPRTGERCISPGISHGPRARGGVARLASREVTLEAADAAPGAVPSRVPVAVP
ncbi:aspartyl protease family protein [Streptomyces bobili]|uniref:aspartyl protease family protein n=1 Tax=Streptomyces bobili TaxID=67280 RepID=UPI0033AFD5EA